MENRKYVVCRDNIYVGEVITTSQIERYNGPEDNHNHYKIGSLAPKGFRSCRSIIFIPNEDNYSDDLLYQSPNYPILNVTSDEECLNIKDQSFVIQHAYNLSDLLEYFNYKKDLTYQDIIKIRNTFFSGRFAKDNCELFGMREIMAEELNFYINEQLVTDQKEIEKCRKNYRRGQKLGYREFEKISKHTLPREYYDILNNRGDRIYQDFYEEWDKSINAFLPHKKEGKIRKLTR